MKKSWLDLFDQHAKTNNDHIIKLLDNMDLANNFQIIHVVGTNGKGSVANFLAQGLMHHHHRVGLFTSPHLNRPNERIQINGVPISDQAFFAIANQLPELHFFASTFLVAMQYFNHHHVDVVILEAGIGGKNDVTNVVNGSIGVITSVGFDHQELLGQTLSEIAKDKAQITNRNMHFYFPSTLSQYQKYFSQNAKQVFEVSINSTNAFPDQNKIIASAILKQEFNINYSAFSNLPGRMELIIKNNNYYILDVAHNIPAIVALLTALQAAKINYEKIVIAIQGKKNISGLEKILPPHKQIYFYRPSPSFHSFENFSEITWTQIKQLHGKILFFGSFLFIGALYETLT